MSEKSTTANAATSGLEVGSLIYGRYKIGSVVGSGGFATVYSAFDQEIERTVAIKVLNIEAFAAQGTSLENVLARFRREAQLAARIRHPSVVQIFDFGVLEPENRPFIIMEMLEGHDLEVELYQKGPMAPARVLPMFGESLDALGEAHRLGIVHKDLKPSNLFLTDPGTRRERLRLVDFGIAHIGEATNSRLTATGSFLGTPAYMAPEYVESQVVSPALDVYQMGLILVEMLTGRPVVDNENPWKCAMIHVSQEFEIPTPLLDGPLGQVIELALARDPQRRYSDAEVFSDALRKVDTGAFKWLNPKAPTRRLSALNQVRPSQPTETLDDDESFGEDTQVAPPPVDPRFAQFAASVFAAPPKTAPSPVVAIPKTEPNPVVAPFFDTERLDVDFSVGQTDMTSFDAMDFGAEAYLGPAPGFAPHQATDQSSSSLLLTMAVVEEQAAPPAKSTLLGLVTVIFAGIIIVTGAAFWAFGTPATKPQPAPIAPVVPVVPGVEVLEESAEMVFEPGAIVMAIRVDSDPSAAALYRGETLLGLTPTTVSFDADSLVVLTARKSGFSDATLELNAQSDPSALIALEALPKVVPKTTTPKPVEKRGPPADRGKNKQLKEQKQRPKMQLLD
ncbi:MAG: serine/threonine protein kinase [Bradymonadaceae bacterium]|nr:serine/threonine protein kinase [Lujinxingiaceae bacterium]